MPQLKQPLSRFVPLESHAELMRARSRLVLDLRAVLLLDEFAALSVLL